MEKSFWMDLALEKSKDSKPVKVYGVAKANSDLSKIDTKYLENRGTLTWGERGNSTPSNIIGEITKCRTVGPNLWVEGFLYPRVEKADQVVNLMSSMAQTGNRKLGLILDADQVKGRAILKNIRVAYDTPNVDSFMDFAKALAEGREEYEPMDLKKKKKEAKKQMVKSTEESIDDLLKAVDELEELTERDDDDGNCPTPGAKIRSEGKGRGLGFGEGKGPKGVPKKEEEDEWDVAVEEQKRRKSVSKAELVRDSEEIAETSELMDTYGRDGEVDRYGKLVKAVDPRDTDSVPEWLRNVDATGVDYDAHEVQLGVEHEMKYHTGGSKEAAEKIVFQNLDSIENYYTALGDWIKRARKIAMEPPPTMAGMVEPPPGYVWNETYNRLELANPDSIRKAEVEEEFRFIEGVEKEFRKSCEFNEKHILNFPREDLIKSLMGTSNEAIYREEDDGSYSLLKASTREEAERMVDQIIDTEIENIWK